MDKPKFGWIVTLVRNGDEKSFTVKRDEASGSYDAVAKATSRCIDEDADGKADIAFREIHARYQDY